jgi:hypothetical protein
VLWMVLPAETADERMREVTTWFHGWGELQRILFIVLPIYIALVGLMRLCAGGQSE